MTLEIDDIYPLSPMQEGLLFQTLYQPESRAYLVQMICDLTGKIDEDVFRRSCIELCQRHAVLRTSFMHKDLSRPLQVVLHRREPEFTFEDLRGSAPAEQQRVIDVYAERERQRGFDLQRDVLMRVGVFRTHSDLHRVVWSYHHILLDGWSLHALQRELIHIYGALKEERAPTLPAVAPYREYIGWLENRDRESALQYWSGYLRGYVQAATLPKLAHLDRSSSDARLTHEFALDPDSSAALKDLTVRLGVTVNIVIQCVWGLLLSRYNNREDVVFGTIVSGRPPELNGVEDMVGLFINAVPVRLQLPPDQPFSRLLQAAQASSLEGEPFHYVPLAEVQSLTPTGRELFDHMLIFENYPAYSEENESSKSAFRIEPVDAHDRTHYDLDVTIVPGDRISLQIGYNANVYPVDQIQRTADHFLTVIQSILRNPEQRLGRIPIMPHSERQRVEYEFNGTTIDYPRDKTILDLFRQHVEATPNAVALAVGDVEVTYRELNTRANRLAHYLRAMGVRPHGLVGICVNRGIEMIVGVLGILKAGGAYVPLDASYPRERLGFMLNDAAVPVLLTEKKLLGAIPDSAACVVCLDADLPTISKYSDLDPMNAVTSNDLAYVVYTSGSTGWPKGVMVEHRSLVNAAYAWRFAYKLDQMDVRSLQMASMSFDVFAGDLVRALTNGGRLIICPDDVRQDPQSLYKLLMKHRIDIFEATPGLIIPLMNYVHEHRLDFDFLKVLIIGSDSLPIEYYRSLIARFGAGMRIINSYGVTEATIDSSYFEASGTSMPSGNTTPIGKPLQNTRFYILDQEFGDVPIGIAGELYIGGEGLARGYLNREALTTERFISLPHAIPERVYKTGDIARWLPDGNMEFLGRADDQVKLRGYRIELGEIQARLLSHPSIESTTVLAREVNGDGRELVAYVVADGGWDVKNLRAYLKGLLPDYMIPSFFVRLDKLPLTHNGKVDKDALPDPTAAAFERSNDYVPPRDSQEEQLVEIWRECLGVDHIGVQDNFFELGGHSLKAMQIVSRIHKVLGIEVSLRDLFARPTIGELISVVKGGRESAYSPIEPAPPQEYYALSHAQMRLWLLHHMEASHAYNMPEAHLINHAVDMNAVRKVFHALLERHEALRTAFVKVNGEPAQKIYPQIDFDAEEIDLSANGDPEQRARAIADELVNTTFDLAKPPLLRAAVIKLARDRHVFVLTIHHIIGDGWSGNVMFRELLALYDAFRRSLPNPLAPLRIQYKDFAVWQNARGFQREEAYWLDRLAGMPEWLRLPYDLPPQEERDFRGSMESLVLNRELAAELRSLAARSKTTLSNVLLALFKLLLFHWTRQDEICVGMSIAGRNHPDLENVLGFFVNVLPIRTKLSADMEFDELLGQVAQSTFEALEHQDYPLDLLVQKFNPNRYGNRQPIFNVVYAFQNFTDVNIDTNRCGDETTNEREGADSDAWSSFEFSFATSKFDLTLFVVDEVDQIRLIFEYDTGLLLSATIRQQLRTLERFAQMIVSRPRSDANRHAER